MVSQSRQKQTGVTVLTVFCLAVAAISAVSISFLKENCTACEIATHIAPVPALHLFGACFYVVLILLLVQRRFEISKLIQIGLYLTAGCHLVLIVVLLLLHVACIPCMICAFCLISAAVAFIRTTPTALAAISTVTGVAICVGTFCLQSEANKLSIKNNTTQAIQFSSWPTQRTGPIKISVFALDRCRICRTYERETLSLVKQRYGSDVVIDYPKAPDMIIIPTTVVGGETPILLTGKPSWNELANAIELNLTTIHRTRLSANHGTLR